jgi:hypothetical protein
MVLVWLQWERVVLPRLCFLQLCLLLLQALRDAMQLAWGFVLLLLHHQSLDAKMRNG